MAYDSFADAYKAKHPEWNPAPKPTPAQTTWTPQNRQALANAYAYGYTNPVTGSSNAGHPTWTPPAEMNAALPNPITPVKFDPYGDVGYAAGASAVLAANAHAGAHHDYNQGSAEQNFGVYAGGSAGGQFINDAAYQNYNPYSQAAILQRNYDNTKRGTTNSYAAQGQLYSGALLNKRGDDAFNYNVGDNALKRAASDYYHNNDYSLTQTQDAGTMTLAQLLGPAWQNFLVGQKGY